MTPEATRSRLVVRPRIGFHLTLRIQAKLSAHGLRRASHDCQAISRAGICLDAVETYKDAEYLALHFRSNANPIVFDPKPQPIASFRAPDSHLRGSIFRREFDRIGNKI